MNKHESISCAFCKDISERTIDENELCFAIRDAYPVTKHHTLIIQIIALDPTITGFNVGINEGTSAGQTIFHAHIHLIPRRDGDTNNPRGGVRGVIPAKQSY